MNEAQMHAEIRVAQGRLEKAEADLERLKKEVAAAVREIPDHVIVREGGADEDVAKSLAVSVGKVKSHVAKLEDRVVDGICEVHNELFIQTQRCEVPANMNGAPRTVCPECIEERAERAERDRDDARTKLDDLKQLYGAACRRLQALGETDVPLV